MADWYLLPGATEPVELPFEWADETGAKYTDLANNPLGRARCGFTADRQVASKPVAEAGKEVGWVDGDWAQVGLTAAALPPEIPMYKVKKYMALTKATSGGATDYHAQVMEFINALPEPNRTLARIDFGPDPEQIGSPNLVVNSALAQGAKLAVGLSDAEWTEHLFAIIAMP